MPPEHLPSLIDGPMNLSEELVRLTTCLLGYCRWRSPQLNQMQKLSHRALRPQAPFQKNWCRSTNGLCSRHFSFPSRWIVNFRIDGGFRKASGASLNARVDRQHIAAREQRPSLFIIYPHFSISCWGPSQSFRI